MTTLLVGAGAGCVLYTAYGIRCLLRDTRESFSSQVLASDAERIPLFLERKTLERRHSEDC